MIDDDTRGGRPAGQGHPPAEPDYALAPPLIDLTGRPTPSPGPLTKPAPVIRPPKKRRRWLIPVIIALVLALAAGAGIAWRAAQNAPLPWYSSTEIGTGIGYFGSLEERLQVMLDKYEFADDDGSLWEVIPETRENRTALVAFRFFLTDMRLAASFGDDLGQNSEYSDRTDEFEKRFLAEEPLGEDIEIAFSEDRIFRYDGATGEGGYSTE